MLPMGMGIGLKPGPFRPVRSVDMWRMLYKVSQLFHLKGILCVALVLKKVGICSDGVRQWLSYATTCWKRWVNNKGT